MTSRKEMDTGTEPTVKPGGVAPKPLLHRLLTALAAMLIVLMAVNGATLWRQHQTHLSERLAAINACVVEAFHADLHLQASGLEMSLATLITDPRLRQALGAGDAERLLADWSPLFMQMRREHGITHLYFHDSKRYTVLRAYNPEKRGGRNNRFTMLEAERTGKAFSGIELGARGTFVLRAVQPVFEAGKLLGYVELGKEIEDVLERQHARSGAHLAVAVHKEHLERRQWEEGMRILGREADWDRLPHSVLIHASQGRLPDVFAPLLAGHDPLRDHTHGLSGSTIPHDGKIWRGTVTILYDAAGVEVGELLVMKETTVMQAAFRRLMILGGAAGGLLLVALLGLVFFLVRRTDADIRQQQETLRHSMEQHQASEEKFRGLAETSIDLIFRISADGLISYCSPAAREIMGREPERMIGTHFHRHIAPEDIGKAQRAFTAALQGENVRLWDLTLRRGDGSTLVGEVNVIPIREDGQIIGAQGVVRDVTRRRQAAAALAHQFMFQKMVADISALFVKMAGDDLDRAIEQALALSGSFFQVDRAYVFLYTPDQTRMNNTHEWCAAGIFFQKERIQDVPCAAFPWLAECLAADKPVHIPEVALLPPEAAAERAEFSIQEIKSLLLFPLHGPERPIGFMGYDSVRRLRSWTDEEIGLLKVVAEIIGNALIRGEVAAELGRKSAELARSNAELTDFAYIASHDLQEPLRKISAFGDRLQVKYETVLDEKGRDYLARMQNAALRMEQLINDLLSYSRVTTKAKPLEPVALSEVLREVLDSLERAREELAAEIEIGELPVVAADRNQMHSLFQNLVGNALKYHRSGVTPRIRVEADPPQGGRVAIRISDNGIGLEEKYAERIFRPFQRLHGRSEYKGSGIGLAICKKIVERYHGEIKVQSTPGQGAVFTVILPWRPQP